ncbi:MAG: DUF4958 family protein [Marinifilum sp.]|jgi:hypothetical protein|nr:DUF4958 family protein [Marinifilum sp.]
MRTSFKLKFHVLFVLFIGLGLLACDDDSKIEDAFETLSIQYPMDEGVDYNALIHSVKTPDGDNFQYGIAKEFVSEKPELEGKLTSIVVKSAISDTDTIEIKDIKMDKSTGIFSIKKGENIKGGVYSMNIQVNTIRQSELKEGVFKLKVVETSLTYPKVDMFQGKAMQSELPTITGGVVPDSYELDGAPDGFTIDKATGVISAEASNTIAIDNYFLSVVVTWGEEIITYKNAIEIKVEKEIITPANLQYEDQSIVVGSSMSVQPTVTGNELTFELASGTPSQFTIEAATGVVKLDDGNDLAIGEYTITVKATNSKGSVEGTLKLEVTAPVPANLVYDPATANMKVGEAFSSNVPNLENDDNVSFKLSDDQYFAIDAATGVISAAEGNKIPAGNYKLDIVVTYQGGEVTFKEAYTITVVEGVVAPADLSYDDKTIFEGDELTANPKTITGTELTFELASGTPSQFTIEAATGTVKLNVGNDLAVGEYTITVKATNSKGSTEGTLKVLVNAKATGNPPANLAYSTADTTVATRSNFKSVVPTIENGDDVVFTISDETNFSISSSGVISFKDGVNVPGDIYNLVVTASNDKGSTTADYKVTVMELRYTPNPVTGTIAAGVTSSVPQNINIGAGTYELKGVYFTGNIGGKDYTDVLLQGGSENYKGDAKEISDALGWTKGGKKVDLNIPRLELLGQGKGDSWDGSIKTNSGSTLLQAGTYSLLVRVIIGSQEVNFEHAVDITLN